MTKIKILLEDGRQMDAELYEDLAPVSVKNFIKLINEKYFDGLIFHRVVKGFVIQGGGHYPNMEQKDKAEEIYGEFKENGWDKNLSLSHQVGVLSMARTQIHNSATSQFFICVGDASFLDGQYASFGKLSNEESIKVAMDISKVSVDASSVPDKNIVIKSIRIEG